MSRNIKRRAFLAASVGTLVGLPFVVRYFSPGKKVRTSYRYDKELKKYQELCEVPIRDISGPASVSLALAPPLETEWSYVMFLPSFLPEDHSQTAPGEPDSFVVREGTLFCGKTPSAQTVIVGGDSVAKLCTPRGQETRSEQQLAVIVQDGKLVTAREKGTSANLNTHRHLVTLLALKPPKKELSIGTKWTAEGGRVYPFKGYRTSYEMLGFAEVGDRKTVHLSFSGKIPNVAQLPGVNSQTPDKNQKMTNEHSGHLYFDLETGLLVRQETDMKSQLTGLSGDLGSLSSNGRMILQVFHA